MLQYGDQNYYYDDYYSGPESSANSGNRRTDNFAAASGGGDCCPHVVDPWLFMLTLGAIPIVVYLLQQAIEMSMLMMARRKRSHWDVVLSGGFKSDTEINFLGIFFKFKGLKILSNQNLSIIIIHTEQKL